MVEEYARSQDTEEDKSLSSDELEDIAQWMGI